MSDEERPVGTPAEPDSGRPEDVWNEFGRQRAELGKAVADTIRTAADDPENQRRARELSQSFDRMAREVGDAFTDAFSGEPGERVKEAAGAVAAAGRAVAEDVRPHLAGFTRKAGDLLRDTAARMDRPREGEQPRDPDDLGPEDTER